MSRDVIFLLQAFSVGVLITFAYDGLRILRRVVTHRQFMVSLEDFLFWVFCAVAVFLWMYRVSNGSLRWFAVAGALTGMLLYKKLFSELLVTYIAKLLKLILGILGKGMSFLLRPIRFAGHKMSDAHGKVRNCRRKILGNFKIWLKSGLKALKIRIKKQ
ncbi:MAG: spore cortex biosynthesis protein YabQ [Lachnospiraceae bacterium]|nr:spore cortex biosynthesis protein YabQ [Lachnospiraceae bacterium]